MKADRRYSRSVAAAMSAMAVFEERQDAANGEPLESDLRRKVTFLF